MPSTTRSASVFATSLPNAVEVVPDAGARLAQRGEDRLRVRVRAERLLEHLGRDRLAVGHLHRNDVRAERLQDAAPALAPASRGAEDRLLARGERVGDRRFHPAGTGAGERVDRLRGLENVLQVFAHLGQDRFRLGRAVIRHRLGEFEQRFFGNGSRAGREQARLHQLRPSEGEQRDAELLYVPAKKRETSVLGFEVNRADCAACGRPVVQTKWIWKIAGLVRTGRSGRLIASEPGGVDDSPH